VSGVFPNSDYTVSLLVSKEKRVRKVEKWDKSGCSSVEECILSIHEAPRSIHTHTHTHTHTHKYTHTSNGKGPLKT
jgi:hypothetical protein